MKKDGEIDNSWKECKLVTMIKELRNKCYHSNNKSNKVQDKNSAVKGYGGVTTIVRGR